MLSRPEDQWPRVLIADDDPELLDEFASILNCEPASPQAESASGSAGPFAVTRCPTGEAAVRAVRQACADGRPYAVVVLDAVMGPGLDGIAAGHRIRGLDPGVVDTGAIAGCPGAREDPYLDRDRAVIVHLGGDLEIESRRKNRLPAGDDGDRAVRFGLIEGPIDFPKNAG